MGLGHERQGGNGAGARSPEARVRVPPPLRGRGCSRWRDRGKEERDARGRLGWAASLHTGTQGHNGPYRNMMSPCTPDSGPKRLGSVHNCMNQ
jgi:hypothetical protein